ncbi:MAG: hypothetical protein WA374_20080 [Acidobacteriaceae bacterium]
MATLCLVPALHPACVRLCCSQTTSACCVAASEPAVVDSAAPAMQHSMSDGNPVAWTAPCFGQASAAHSMQLQGSFAVNLKAPPGVPGFALALRI